MSKSGAGLAFSVCLILIAAPSVSGCQPLWAWGPLWALLCAAGAALLLLRLLPRREEGLLDLPLGAVVCAGLAVLAWAGALHLYDLAAGVEAGRFPIAGRQQLVFACGWAGIFLAGLEAGRTTRRLLWVFRLAAGVCAVYAAVCWLQWAGLFPLSFYGWTTHLERPSGFYTNPNRHAVLLSMGWACSLGLLGLALFSRPVPKFREERRRWWLGLSLPLGLGLLICWGIALSLSRLTVLGMGLALGGVAVLALLRLRSARRRGEPLRAAAGAWSERLGGVQGRHRPWALGAALLVPSAALLVAATILSQYAFGRRLGVLMEESFSRAQLSREALPLALAEPLTGLGLGSFETVYRLRQPPEMTGRYVELHNEWLQLAVELGWPALLGAALCAGLWFHLVRRGLRPRDRFGFWLISAGAAAVFVPLFCSVADFPLREPANAAWFFFLAGAVAAAAQRRARAGAAVARRTGQGSFAKVLAPLLSPALALVLVAAGWAAGRCGLAACLTPWLGFVRPPPPNAEDAEAYRQGLAWAQEATELLFPCAQSELAVIHSLVEEGRPEQEQAAAGQRLEETLERMKSVNPRDYRTPWLRGHAQRALGRPLAAAKELERAVELAPPYREVRRQAVETWLHCWKESADRESPEARAYLERALHHLRMLMHLEPGLESRFLSWLAEEGVGPREQAGLFPGDNAPAALRRARLYIASRLWLEAEEELAKVSAPEQGALWFQALRGRTLFEQDEPAAAVSAWREALRTGREDWDPELEEWLSMQVTTLRVDHLERAAVELSEAVCAHSGLAIALARQLGRAGLPFQRHALMEQLTGIRPSAEAFRELAEAGGALGDYHAALRAARRAYELSDRSGSWRNWLKTAESRWEPKRKPKS